MLNADPNSSFEDLQRSLMVAVSTNTQFPALGLISHAAILIKTSKNTVDAVDELREEIRRLDSKNGKLQNWVIGLAVVSLFATCVQTFVALFPSSPTVALQSPVTQIKHSMDLQKAPEVKIFTPVSKTAAPVAKRRD